MSIIYEALKKTQENRQTSQSVAKQEVVIPRSNRTKVTLLFMFGIVISAFFAYERFGGSIEAEQKFMSSKKLASNPPKNLQINGTFFADQIKMAMINHQMYHVGDTVGDMKIIGIETDKVEFHNEQGDITLPVSA